MSARNRFEQRSGGPSSLPVIAALLVTALAAVAALDPLLRAGGALLLEVAAYLAVAVLILAAARGAETTTRLFRRRRPTRLLPARLARRLARVAGEALLTCLLVVPALAVGWEAGAGAVELRDTAILLGAAIACGSLFGALFGALLGALPGGLSVPVHTVTMLSVSAAAFLLWPATLGGFGGLARRFPATEPPPVVLLAVPVLMLAALVAAARLRTRAAS